MRDKQHSFPFQIHSRLGVRRTSRLKNVLGGWVVSQQSTLFISVFLSNRVKEVQVGGVHLTASNIVSLFLNSAGNDFVFFHLHML